MRLADIQRVNSDLLRPLLHTSWRFYLLVACFGGIVLTALVAWMSQMYFGFGITGIGWMPSRPPSRCHPRESS